MKDAALVTVLSDTSNHNETKLYPILVIYYHVNKGIQVKILNLESIEGEIAEIINRIPYTVLKRIPSNK